MSNVAQRRALKNYRARLRRRGLARFEVLGLDKDRELIRSLAKRLAEDDPQAAQLRAAVNWSVPGESAKKGGVLAAFLQSPLAGANIEFRREVTPGRKIDL
jgi:hypothetical protein